MLGSECILGTDPSIEASRHNRNTVVARSSGGDMGVPGLEQIEEKAKELLPGTAALPYRPKYLKVPAESQDGACQGAVEV